MPKVSIIMPVYNAEKFLEFSVGSVMAQDCDDWELICFNDASTDNSLSILQSYTATDSRIRVIDSKDNVKQGAGRNRAIREAKGQYILFLDADDTLSQDTLSRSLSTVRNAEADMVLFDYETEPGNKVSPLGDDAENLNGDDLRLRILQRTTPLWTAMYSRALFVNNNLYFPEKVFYEDNAVALALQLSAKKPIKINAPLYQYHIYDTSVSHRLNDYRFFHRLSSAETLKNHLVRLGLYERWRDEIDFILINQYYTHSVTGCVYRFDRVPMDRLHYIRATIGRLVPDFRHNPYYSNLPLPRRIKLELHARFPRMLNMLWQLKRKL